MADRIPADRKGRATMTRGSGLYLRLPALAGALKRREFAK
jgi:hypothetical protein